MEPAHRAGWAAGWLGVGGVLIGRVSKLTALGGLGWALLGFSDRALGHASPARK